MLANHSRTCKTSGKLSWTFWQYRRLLKIIEKYFQACKTFKYLLNFKKGILDLLAIKETFKNHKKYFEACKTFQDLSKFRKIILDILAIRRLLEIIQKHFEACKTFQDLSNFRKIILDLLAIQETCKNHRKIF